MTAVVTDMAGASAGARPVWRWTRRILSPWPARGTRHLDGAGPQDVAGRLARYDTQRRRPPAERLEPVSRGDGHLAAGVAWRGNFLA